jgi:hypothetical protein
MTRVEFGLRAVGIQETIMDISVDKIRELIVEVRRLDVKEADSDPDTGSNAIDDGNVDMLSSSDGEDASEHEFRGLVAGLNSDERADVLALLYVGRGDFPAAEWNDALALARERDSHPAHLGNYLVGTPNLPDLLSEGLAALGGSPEDDGSNPADETADDTVEVRHLPQAHR